jgi:hypothetical protein
VDASGNVYVADTNNQRIQKFDSNGTFITKWGVGGGGNGQFSFPTDVAVDPSGNVYVVDNPNLRRIQKFDTNGTFLAKLSLSFAPQGVAIDASGNVYVADYFLPGIQKLDSNGTFIRRWGSPGSGNGQFFIGMAVAVDPDGNVYAADGNSRIQKFDTNGTFVTKWGTFGTGDGQFSAYTWGVAADAAGTVYVADASNLADPNTHRVQKFDSSGTLLTKWGSFGTGAGQFKRPFDVTADGAGNVYVADTENNRIQKFANAPPPDSIPPTITIAAPTDTASYSLGATVPADYACNDAGSGLATCAGPVADGAAIDTASVGPHTFTVNAMDVAGNAASVTHHYTVTPPPDTTPPTITITSPADGASHGLGTTVPADYACDDAGSGFATCVGSVADGAAIDTSTLGPKTITVNATDAADNTATLTHTYTITDTTPPRITITTPTEGASYPLGGTAVADYACDDADSAIASCIGPAADGAAIDTSTVGAKSFTVNATDAAGNTATRTHAYTVAYSFNGFFAPVDNTPIFNRVKAGAAVPTKFNLDGNQGLGIFAAGYPAQQPISCDATATFDQIEETVTSESSGLLYDTTADQYKYVWKTQKAWAGTCRQLIIKLADGTSHLAYFSFQ